MRVTKAGERYFADESLQRQTEIVRKKGKHIPPTPHQMLLTHMRQALGHLDWFAPRCKVDEAVAVVAARTELRLLIQFLETNNE